MSNSNHCYRNIGENELQEVIKKSRSRPAVLVFSANWDGNSTMLDFYISGLCREFSSRIQFCRVDHDEAESIFQQYGVEAVPTTLLMKDQEVVGYFMGVLPQSRIGEKLLKLL